ncbi:hypothetical protein NP493_53g08114 [Ridgeia piscesae]|uniref:Uncharacterized protein n=1 Tax=Ridgeia piscesae TaxID=27915 RepID=A0AAD9UJ28_RIDPI|nr:hypothetical protein NP493_53g08114 [Ridgeia piscesae]
MILFIPARSSRTYRRPERIIPHIGFWNLVRHDGDCDFGCSHNKSLKSRMWMP